MIYDPINWNFLASFSKKPVENCFIYLVVARTACAFSWRRHSFLFQRICVNLCLFFTHVERVFFGTSYFDATSLFVIPFSKPFKALHFKPTWLLFNLRFMGTIFLLQRTKNGLFEFTDALCCSKMECIIPKRWKVRILVKKFKFYWKSSER